MTAHDRGRLAARTMLVADVVVVGLVVPLLVLGGVGLVRLTTVQMAYAFEVAWLAGVVAVIAAIVFLIRRRGTARDPHGEPRVPGRFGDDRWLGRVAWATLFVIGTGVALPVVEVVRMLLYYDGQW